MGKHRKMTLCGVLLLILSLCFTSGCGEKPNSTQKINPPKLTQSTAFNTGVISAAELKSIANSATVRMADDMPAAAIWVPKIQTATLSEILLWLQQSQSYQGEIPRSQISGSQVFEGNIDPSKLYLSTSDQHEVRIQPAFYLALNADQSFKICFVENVLQLDNDNQKSYIQSAQLFNWLKNNRWKTEFHMQ